MDSAYFSGRSGCYLIFLRNFFLVFKIWIHSGKPLVLEVLCLEVGISVASVGTAETMDIRD